MSIRADIHVVKSYTKMLKAVLKRPPYNGSQLTLAGAIGVTPAHLSRVLSGEREFSPKIIGKVARLLSVEDAQELIKCYLREIAEEIAQQQGREAVVIR